MHYPSKKKPTVCNDNELQLSVSLEKAGVWTRLFEAKNYLKL